MQLKNYFLIRKTNLFFLPRKGEAIRIGWIVGEYLGSVFGIAIIKLV